MRTSMTLSCGLLGATLYVGSAHAGVPIYEPRTERAARRDAHREPRPPIEKYLVSIRLGLGDGRGSGKGMAGRVGGHSEYWFGDHFGAGLAIGYTEQSQIMFANSRRTAFVAMPVFTVRSAPRGGYVYVAGGAGFGEAKRTRMEGWIGSGPETTVLDYQGYSFGLAVGWLGHPGASEFEIGPVARLDTVTDLSENYDYALTLNVEFGLAIGTRPKLTTSDY